MIQKADTNVPTATAHRHEVQASPHPVSPKQHHPKEAGLEEEGGKHFIGHQRPNHWTGLVGEPRPIGPELIRHHEPGHDPHCKGDRENFGPEVIESPIDPFRGLEAQRL